MKYNDKVLLQLVVENFGGRIQVGPNGQASEVNERKKSAHEFVVEKCIFIFIVSHKGNNEKK